MKNKTASIFSIFRNNRLYRMTSLVAALGLIAPWEAAPLHAACISDTPMETSVLSPPPNIMFIFDNSGSMGWEFMTSEEDGLFYRSRTTYAYVYNMADNVYSGSFYKYLQGTEGGYWKGQWSGYNRIFYDPHVDYMPWPRFQNADTSNPRSNPVNATPTIDLNGEFYCIGDISIKNAHYYTWNDANSNNEVDAGEIWLVNFVYDGSNWTRQYYQFLNDGNDEWVDSGELASRSLAEVPDAIRPKVYDEQGNFVRYKTDLGDLQNFANWFSYYRRRELAAKAAVSRSISDLERVYVGIYTINQGVRQPVLPIKAYSDAIISDNKDSSYAEEGRWDDSYNSNSRNPYNGSARYTKKRGSSATWTPNLPQAGDYNVYAWWNCYGDRDQNAKYTITHAGGSTIVYKNQRKESGNVCGEWVLLGTYSFNAGTGGSVRVERHSGSTGSSTLADAVKFELTSGSVIVDSTDQLLDLLYGINSSGGTPLRWALLNVGRYFDADDGLSGNLGTAPWAAPEDGGGCQQAFSILMTDGYWNGDDDLSVGNQDGDQGSPYADAYSNTLADVAMKFYKEDLANSLDNIVPTNSCDEASHQHLVTYGVSFGVPGSLDVAYYTLNNTDPCLQNVKAGLIPAPSWPNPTYNCSACPYKIDDLWHATVNGRGAFFSASDPEALVGSLRSIMENIEGRLASGASVSVNSEELNSGTVLYQSSYDAAIWTGDLKAFPVDPQTGKIKRDPSDVLWSASEKLQTQDWDTGRVILTRNDTNGLPFRFDNLSDAQKTALDPAWGTDDTNAKNIVDYIRGKEVSGFRSRSRKLGDLVHSAPLLVEDTIYVGGNDGMLHAFDSNTGLERFAYVPGFVFENLPALTEATYTNNHKFYVDLTPVAKKINATQTLLVGGLGKGGKGYFALNIKDAKDITDEATATSRVLWEFPSAANPNDPNRDDNGSMGYSFSVPSIVQIRMATGHRWAVIFGNGYGSDNGNAVLYVIDALTGELIKKIDTGVGPDNGLSTPAVVDVDADFLADYVYAGDLKGNLWKFDLKDPDPNNWKIAFSDGTNPKPLFQALGQPITTRPDVMRHCNQHGYMVVFGTGKYLCDDDRTDTTTQSVYGIWDYGDDSNDSEYLGSFNRADGTLSNQPKDVTLLKQEIIDERTYNDHYLRTLSAYKAHWYTVTDADPGQKTNPGASVTAADNQDNDNDGEIDEPDEGIAHVGWYFDLPISLERVIKDVFIRDGKAILLTFIPNDSPCSGGGQSILHEMDACSGARLDQPQFDINGDRVIDSNDLIEVDINGKHVKVAPTGIGYPYLLHNPVFLRLPATPDRGAQELKIFAGISGGTVTLREKAMRIGFYYWIER